MIDSLNIIYKLIDRYDYGGALELMIEEELENTDAAILIDSCRYAINFDFKKAKRKLYALPSEVKNVKEIKEIELNLKELIKGSPEAMFSELLESIKFQIVNEEFIDFLGRVYRFKEAIFKYMFIRKHLNRTNFYLLSNLVSKRNILKILRKQYRIYNSNLVYALTTYFNRSQKDDYKYVKIIKTLNSEKMTSLIELRNESVVGHGFVGVSVDEIYKHYGNPYNVLDDFRNCLDMLDIKINRYKYSNINDLIKKRLEFLNNRYAPSKSNAKFYFE
ncbi:hypothetical protein [Helicovermis profundi]|uniref:Uncharacterized protein n=1 Tax=Helicovermis profundi TaxID=3065157 RepID=A0AAU9E617_9FIRM|nr:hypothetical protein HLPR_04030 [Clostridia bacterium S502]